MGTTLNSWCRSKGLTRQYVEKCLKYERNGLKSEQIREMAASAAGCSNSAPQHIDETE
jgi:hypothetical protein